ncbi:MAG: hypothetical protein QOH00_1895 [Gaiellales bacterium]|nr:hypothetical protein [Gaiellales bacterium]
MARRSLLVAVAAIAAALVPATAQAATPGVTSAQFASPVTLSWTPDAAATQTLFRAPGACSSPPMAGQADIGTSALGSFASSASDTPGDGVFCYYIQNDGLGFGGTAQATVDTANPTAGVGATPLATPNFVRLTVTITGDSADTGSGVASSVLHFGAVGACEAGPVTTAWVTTAVADGSYDICNVVTDNAGHTATATTTVVVDNATPLGSIVTPAAGTAVGGTAVALTTDAADATSGIRNVQWRWTGTTGGAHNIGAVITSAANGYVRNWNTSTATGHPPDGPVTISAVVTDNAGNAVTVTTPAIVDNTAPDVKAVVTAPPAVAGSPTINWTSAHDAVGITRYDVLRGPTVIGTVAAIVGAPTYSFNDANAPDHATSTYVVRAYDGAGHFVDSTAVAVLVDSSAVSAPHNVAATTPTSSSPALNWQAPVTFAVNHYDIYRDGLLAGSTVGPATTFTDASAAEGTHDYAVLARDTAAHPGVLSSSFKVVFDKTPPTSGGAPTAQVLPTGQVNLAWPAAGDALSGVAGYIVRRASGGTPPAATDGGAAVCAPAQPGCADLSAATGTWSYGVFARDAAGNVALIGTVSNVAVNDKTAPLAPTKLTVTRAKSKRKTSSVKLTLRWVKPTAADLDRIVVVLNLKRDPVGPADGKTIYHGLGTSVKFKLLAGQTGYIALYSFDHSGNYSPKPLRRVVTLASLIPLRPLTGSVVRSSTPHLTWKAMKGTTYYNLQLFRNGKRMLVGWPGKASYRIPSGKLEPGTYVWFVWPAVQHKGSAPTFGKLIGRATFTYKK